MATEALAPAEPIAEQPRTAIEQVKASIEQLKKPELTPREVMDYQLAQVIYAGASQLQVSEAQSLALAQYRDAPDEDMDIRPDGLVFVGHMWYRRVLTEIFGHGRWALMPKPGSPMQTHETGDKVEIQQTWILHINGCYVAQAMGTGHYWRNNPGQDVSDAIEASASNALMRCAAKYSLGIGTNPWNRRQASEWRKRYAKRVIVSTPKGNAIQWRRIDADPLPNEIGDAPPPKGQPAPQSVPQEAPKPAPAPGPQAVADKPKPPAEAPKPAPKPAPAPAKEPLPNVAESEPVRGLSTRNAKEPVPAVQHLQEAMTTNANFRLFMRDARLKGLVVTDPETRHDDATKAIAFVCSTMDLALPTATQGKTTVEILNRIFMGLSFRLWNGKLLPALRNLEG
jgi:Mitochondrial genome maintenance MGM101